MAIIDIDYPKKYFEKDRNNRLEARLAKFKLQKGDVLRFFELDKRGKRTGRFYDRKVKDFHKIHKATKYWKKRDLTKYGIYILEMEPGVGTPLRLKASRDTVEPT